MATLCAATSLTSVVAGWAWFGYLFVAVVLVAATGLALRSLRAPIVVAGLGQLLVLLFMVTGAFTTQGVLKIIPGPAAFGELQATLAASAEQIRTGLPPVEGTQPILCLVTIAIGLVAVLVDTLAVAASAPAATGLVLLCVYAVPAALSEDMLPWWTFLLGAAAFAGLLALDGNHRHRSWRNREASGAPGRARALQAPVAVVSAAVVLGLLGGGVSWVGTVGKIPFGSGPGGGGDGTGGFGVAPFTQLRGLLDQGDNTELFQVRGLGPERRLMRAFTLDSYTPNKGWGLRSGGQAQTGVVANSTLPAAPGDDGTGASQQIRIQPTRWVDNWLPIYGAPRALRGVPPQWLYDRMSGAVFTTKSEPAPPYVETASLKEPSAAELRTAAPKSDEVPAFYTRLDGVDQRVVDKTGQLIAGKNNNFDRATALWQFFSTQNGFVYDTKTADATDADALADFILNGKRGYCEQYASAMAVMLRVAHIPARVAIGFTPGVQKGDYQSISSQDAHAWVEAYFGDKGWVSFDPTPLADGRGIVPPYLQQSNQNQQQPDATEDLPTAPRTTAPSTGAAPDQQQDQAAPANPADTGPDNGWLGWLALALAVLGAAAVVTSYLLRRRPEAGGGTVSGLPPPPPGPEGDLLVRSPAVAAPAPARTAVLWLPPVAWGLFVAAIGFLAGLVAWWFAVLVVLVLVAVSAPAVVRDVVRRRHLQTITAHTPDSADAAWRELKAECADRGLPLPESDTVRVSGGKIAEHHHLDDEGRESLRTVLGAVERSWYSDASTPDPDLAPAFDRLRGGLRRTAPLPLRGRLFPRSVLQRDREGNAGRR
ncbi:transglutaminase-like putative cysteine protease [Amycolatopsis jiangsuensis]|uniref:Transglutaminase-like putative cysteine protease n=1 Tax=Amycolatopsis jiangsuensis TaxID=1181879 RepID=A0A840IKF2_9PSEU|nr:transglutaminase-like putative cysteine protease [Amycolatopsis jiangsuensis]